MVFSKLIAIPVAVLGALLVLGCSHPLQAAVPPAPLAIENASLTQQGQDLVWTVELAHPFSAAGLEHDGRSLCLLIARGAATTSVCVAPGAHGIALHTAGPRRTVKTVMAMISRRGPAQMTAQFLPSALGLGYGTIQWQTLSAIGTNTSAFPARSARLRMHVPRVVGCTPAGPSEVSQGPTTAHEIALTFDDGPWGTPPTTAFVDLLARDHVPATFFEIGEQIPEYDASGAVERQMLADGDMIGDHTWTHPDMVDLSPSAQTSELELTAEAIHKRTGFTPCLWRPPYGDVDPQLTARARALGFLTIMWDVDPRDWALPGTGAIESNVISNAHNGAIVIQHFGGGPRYETLAALPTEIATLRARGYRFVTVAQLLGLRLIYK